MSRDNENRVPVTILRGFLGAGKTTLLNRIPSENHGKRMAVIENKFGEVGIDHELVIGADEKIFEMNNRFICCTVRGDLIRALSSLMKRRDRFDYILYVVLTGEDLRMTGYETKVRALAWDPTGRALATSGGSPVTAWDCSIDGPEGSEPARLGGHGDMGTALFFPVDGCRMFSGGRDGRVIEWNVVTGQVIHKLEREGEVSVLTPFGAEGRFVIGTREGEVTLMDVRNP